MVDSGKTESPSSKVKMRLRLISASNQRWGILNDREQGFRALTNIICAFPTHWDVLHLIPPDKCERVQKSKGYASAPTNHRAIHRLLISLAPVC
jgi:hypothetical protein